MDSRRQQQIGHLLQEEMATLFTRHGRDWYGAAFVTLTEVTVTPDLEEARFFVSVYNVADKSGTVDRLNAHAPEIRFKLGNAVRHQLRRIPSVTFFLDDGMERADRVERLLQDG
jgi:ribosome-binding factor A